MINSTNQKKRDEVNRARNLTVQNGSQQPETVRDGRALQEAGRDRERRGDEDGYEVAKLLEPVVAGPALVHRSSDAYWMAVESAFGKTSHVRGTNRLH
jgi:hypothetical protein